MMMKMLMTMMTEDITMKESSNVFTSREYNVLIQMDQKTLDSSHCYLDTKVHHIYDSKQNILF